MMDKEGRFYCPKCDKYIPKLIGGHKWSGYNDSGPVSYIDCRYKWNKWYKEGKHKFEGANWIRWFKFKKYDDDDWSVFRTTKEWNEDTTWKCVDCNYESNTFLSFIKLEDLN